MKIKVVSAGTDDIEYQYRLTNPNKEIYCQKHGYEYTFIQILKEKLVGWPHMLKPYFARTELDEGNYDYVVLMDCDAWFHNMDKKFEDLIQRYSNVSLIAAHDDEKGHFQKEYHDCYVNSGVLIFKNNDIAREIIRRWENPPLDGHKWMIQHSPLHDQPYLSIRLLWDEFVIQNSHIVWPQDLNKFVFSGYDNDTFILHYPGTTERKEDGIKRWNDWAVPIIKTK